MTEIPEHLRKRAEEARAKAAAASGASAGDDAGSTAVGGRSRQAEGEGGEATPGDASSTAVGGRSRQAEGEGGEATPGDASSTAVGGRSSQAEGEGGEATPGDASSGAESRIPAHLLERSKAAKAKAAAGDAPASTEVATAGGGVATAVATAAPPVATGPGGHTQRLLTVVKSGSIQDVKALPQDKVHVWPHLLVVEFVAALACTAFLLVFSVFVNAPLLELANVNQTPNPSKAPWYFLGLQELLKWFHPMVAGVMLPGMGLVGLILAPYTDRNPSNKPENRKFAISLMTMFLMYWAVLVMIGTFFRGPGFNFIFPWNLDLFVEL